jgi:uncharacterized membrane protein YfcA
VLVEALQRRHGDDVDDVATIVLGAALVLAAVGLLAKTLILGQTGSDRPYVLARRDRVLAVSIGLVGGFLLGLTSVGSGTFFGLMLIMMFPLTAAKVVGTDIFHAALLLWAAGMAHVVRGNVDFVATGWLALGSIPGILAGSQLTVRLPETAIRLALGIVLFVSGLKLVGVF